ncbi:MAG: anthranilate phosphoribosyltransferase [Ignavibacteria bacterium]|nr:anthranilate phosphoribosyltransferase [Ignavibacteria bacterium]
MIQKKIEKVINRENLTVEESVSIMNQIMEGTVNNSLIAALLIGLKSKGESAEEVAGFVKTMRDKSIKIKCADPNAVDVCGTGGDESGTINISTAASFVVAGAGFTVAKHGNRSISSKSGSADVLAELGINIGLSPEKAEKSLNEIGITFMFAPLFHPAMKYVMPVRKELAMRTVFNMLGPLTNPAGTKRQLIGTFNDTSAELISMALPHLDMEKVLVICTENKFDEITLTGNTIVREYSHGKSTNIYKINNETFGYPFVELEQIKGNSAAENAAIITKIFTEKGKTPLFYVIAANAAMGLYAAGAENSLIKCAALAEDSILSGKALGKIEELKHFMG